MTSQQFIYRLSSILEHNSSNKRREREKSGKINSGRLGKYGATTRLFSRKSVEHKEKDYSIALLVDASGSMGQYFDDSGMEKKDLAQDVVSMLSHQLARIKGVKFEITIFNGLVMQAKSFDEPFVEKSFRDMYMRCYLSKHSSYWNQSKRDLVDVMSPTPSEEADALSREGYIKQPWNEYNAEQNYDGLAIYRIYKRLTPRAGKRVIVTFSDGQPTAGTLQSYANGAATLRGDKTAVEILNTNPHDSVIKAINAMKREDVETIGIGIGSEAVKKFYKHTAIIHGKAEFYNKTLTALSKVFRKV